MILIFRRLPGYEVNTWVNHEDYLFNDDGVHVVYTTGLSDVGAGAATFWGPGKFMKIINR